MQRKFILCLLLLFIVMFLVACGGPEESTVGKSSTVTEVSGMSGAECLQTINTKCTSCHYITRICQSLDKKGKLGWKSTVRSMVKKGAKLSKSEQQSMLQCLIEPGEELLKACAQYR